MEWLQLLAEAACFDWGQAMMAVVEQVQFFAELLADTGEQSRYVTQVEFC